jgi:hypothetical protein
MTPTGSPVGAKNEHIAAQVAEIGENIGAAIEPSRSILERISAQLDQISQQLAASTPRPALRQVIPLDSNINPFQLQTRGYRHNRLRVTGAVTLNVQDNLSGSQATYALSLTAGWNVLDLPNGSRIFASAGTIAEIEYTDFVS